LTSTGRGRQTRPAALFLLLIIGASSALAVIPLAAGAQTCTNCTPVGFGNSNYNLYPYAASGSQYPPASLDVGVLINSTFSATGYFTGATEGCTADGQWTYQNNFFDPSGEFIQEVLAIGLTSATPSCFTVEWGPAGTTQVYNYMAVELPSVYTPDLQSAGNRLDFVVQGVSGTLPSGEVNVTAFDLYLNSQLVGTLTPSQMLNYSTGQPLNGADGPVFYTAATGQNFDIVGPGGGQAIIFTSGSGTISYCGTVPNSPPELGGLVGSQGGTVEDSNLFYGNVTASSAACSEAPSAYSQYFNVLPEPGSNGPTPPTGTAGCDQGAASSGVEIFYPTCTTAASSPSLSVTGNDSLSPGNYAVGFPGQALGFPCNNGNTANPPGCPSEPQLNFLRAWVDGFNPSAGTFQVHMTTSDLSDLTTAPPPGQGQLWSFQWTYGGRTYFAQMDEWITDAVAAPGSGPFQAPGITFWYGTVNLTEINTGTPAGGLQYANYNYIGTLSGSYTPAAPGTITLTVPVADVGNPVAGSVFTGVTATTAQVYGTYDPTTASYFGLQLINNPDTVYAALPYTLGTPLLPIGYVQVAVLQGTQTPGAGTNWQTATLENYPNTNDWQATVSLASSPGGDYTVYAREVNNYTGSAGPSSSTSFQYAPTVAIGLNPASGSIKKGTTSSTVATISGGVQTVYLSIGTLPAGVSVSMGANPVTSYMAGLKDVITFHVSGAAKKGSYTVVITAIGSDGSKADATYTLSVT
jgi:hypothetical protein